MERKEEGVKLVTIFITSVILLSIAFYGVGNIYYQITHPDTGYIIDETSGEKISKIIGAVTNGSISAIGFKTLYESGIDPKSYDESLKYIESYIAAVNEKFDSISLIKDSLKVDNSKYSFSFKINTGEKYDSNIEEISGGKIRLTISNNNGVIYEIDNTKIKRAINPAETIKSILPHSGKTDDNLEYTIVYNPNTTKYQIKANTCGNYNSKSDILKSANSWLESVDYAPSDFEFEIPDYCEGGMH